MENELFGVTVEKLVLAGSQTIYMLGWGMIVGGILGVITALGLVLTRRGGLMADRVVYGILNVTVNIIRSIPFIILLVAIMPLTRLIMGTPVGTQAQLVPLVIYITPYIARLVRDQPAGGQARSD